MKLSIITICYNNLEGLKRTYQSVVDQTARKDFEWIVIDGASTDGTPVWLHEHDSEIDKWLSEPDTGIYNAMNKGIRMASGEYCLFLNSGDYLCSPKSIGTCIDQIDPFYDLIYTDLNVYDPKNHKLTTWTYPETLQINYLHKGSLPHPCTFIRISLFDAFMYNEDNKIASDWEFFFRQIIFCHATYKKIPGRITTFVYDGISSDYQKSLKEQLYRYDIITPTIIQDAVNRLDYYESLPYLYINRFLSVIIVTSHKLLSKLKSYFLKN